MYKIKIVFLLLITILLNPEVFSQPELRIDPDRVRFRDVYTRIDSTFFINRGDQVLTIDSLEYTKSDYYRFSFEDNRQIPFTINPDDTVTVYVILENFYNIVVTDTVDTIWVHNNGDSDPERLRIRIDFFDDDEITISCYVKDSFQQPLINTTLYYLYYGIYLINSAVTGPDGYYSITLPKGSYTVAAAKEGYRTLFNDDTPDPYFAPLIALDSGQVTTINYTLPAIENIDLSVAGKVFDTLSGNIINKGVIIVRKGNHTPSRGIVEDSSVYAGFINPDGSYNVSVEQDTFYYVQAYSDYFLPGYYNSNGNASVFWQSADSVLIDSHLTDKDLFLLDDLSFGGGTAIGSVNLSPTESSGYEGISLFARSVYNGNLYSYNFGKEDGSFRVDNIPYGTYELIAQRVGFPNAISQPFTIDSLTPAISNLLVTFNTTSVSDGNNLQPLNFVLYQNYPNPFNPSTVITWQSAVNGYQTLKVYDVLGRELVTLVDEYLYAGKYEVVFDASGLASGIYFYELNAGEFREAKKFVLLK